MICTKSKRCQPNQVMSYIDNLHASCQILLSVDYIHILFFQIRKYYLTNILNYSVFKIEMKGTAGPEGLVDEQMRRQTTFTCT